MLVNEGTLGVHEIDLVVNAGQDLSHGSGVGNHAHSALDAGGVTNKNNGRKLIVDTALDADRDPVDEPHSAFGLDGVDA